MEIRPLPFDGSFLVVTLWVRDTTVESTKRNSWVGSALARGLTSLAARGGNEYISNLEAIHEE
jgi:hypothetical protein